MAVLNGAWVCFTSAMLAVPTWLWLDRLSSAIAWALIMTRMAAVRGVSLNMMNSPMIGSA
ncbi:hypothetical protein D3C81_1742370 [compost metagenome]